MLFLTVEDSAKSVFLDRQKVDLQLFDFRSRGVRHDIDQAVECVQAAEKIIVLPVGAREKRGKMAKANAFEALDAIETLQATGILRADAVDQDLAQLANLLTGKVRTSQNGKPR